METTLIQTKLHAPPVLGSLVERLPLIQKLNQGLDQKLTLLSAPAGFGKTTLLTSWLAQIDAASCWVSLDEYDNDPMQFWSYVMAALQTVFDGLGDNAMRALQESPVTFVPALVNDIANNHSNVENVILVLDDYHVIQERSIHDGLIFLLTHLPFCLHVVIISRADPPFPLPRWRVRGQLAEIRDADLRFTEAEAAVFLNKIMHLNLSKADSAAIEARTEGWVAGLKLAALAMQAPTIKPEERHNFITTFTGSDRYIVDYLLEEVLQQQPAYIQEFLLETATLDRLCASLCDAMLTEGIQPSAHILRYLDQANLFLIPLDNQRQWYRYHHLFADLLRYRIKEIHPQRIPALHRRAASWFEAQGFLAEAVGHALAAEDYNNATRLITQSAHDLFAAGKMMVLLTWLNKLPQSYIYQRQKLFLLQAWLLLRTGQFAASIAHLQHPLPEDELPDQSTQAEYTYLQGSAAYYKGDWAAGLALGQQALAAISPQNLALYLPAQSLIAWCYEMLGQPDDASTWHQRVLQMSERANILTATLSSLGALAQLYAAQGELNKSQNFFEKACKIAGASSQSQLPILGLAYLGSGMVAQRRRQWKMAIAHLQEGIDLCRRWGGLIVHTLKGYILLAQVFEATGDQIRAQETDSTFLDLVQQTHVPARVVTRVKEMTQSIANSSSVEPLTKREKEILILIINGRSVPQIADELVIGASTVRTHVKRIYAKLGVHSRHEAIARAQALGLAFE